MTTTHRQYRTLPFSTHISAAEAVTPSDDSLSLSHHVCLLPLLPLTPPQKVDFFVGPDPEHMSKVMFDEGRVVELNNQAKHAVTNGWSRDRVHLILDYVDVSCFVVVWCGVVGISNTLKYSSRLVLGRRRGW